MQDLDVHPGSAELLSALRELRRLFALAFLFSAFVNLPLLTGPLYMIHEAGSGAGSTPAARHWPIRSPRPPP